MGVYILGQLWPDLSVAMKGITTERSWLLSARILFRLLERMIILLILDYVQHYNNNTS